MRVKSERERDASDTRVCSLLDKTGGRGGKKERRNGGVHVQSLETEKNGA